MPIYEYHCGKCGDFEVMQKMSDKPLGTCPTCRRKVNKLISSTSFQLKGSGWYITDYARKGGAGGSEKSSKSEDKKSDSGDGAGKASGETASSGESSKSSGEAGKTSGGDGASKSGASSKKSGKAGSEKAAAA